MELGDVGGSGRGERMEAMAWNSAWRVPLRVRFVAFMPRAMTVELWTNTQPTGVSSVSRASWAWCCVSISVCILDSSLSNKTEKEIGEVGGEGKGGEPWPALLA